jgi:hypothetical protein
LWFKVEDLKLAHGEAERYRVQGTRSEDRCVKARGSGFGVWRLEIGV